MEFKITSGVDLIIESKVFSRSTEIEKYELIIDYLKQLVIKFLLSYEIKVSNEDKLSNMLILLNNCLDEEIKHRFNFEITHALVRGMIASSANPIQWIETDDKRLRSNPIFTYDVNMTLQSIKTYSDMDLSKLSILLIRNIEGYLMEDYSLRLKTTK